MNSVRSPDAARCRFCDSQTLHAFSAYELLNRVTSDCRPWRAGGRLQVCEGCGLLQKPADRSFAADAREIYRDYAVYYQGGGQEQKVFGSENAWSRSEKLLAELRNRIEMKPGGKLLDIGCGNGGLLRSFGRLFPGWDLFGSELNDKYRAEVEQIPNVNGFFSGDIDGIDARFDMVTMIHCLEHIDDPGAFLKKVGKLLRPGGLLVLEIPDYRRNPFDLLIADHCLHFDPDTISTVAGASGFAIDLCSGEIVPKELTAVLRPGTPPAGFPDKESGRAGKSRRIVDHHLQWLCQNAERAKHLSGNGKFGIFGTSIAAVWLLGEVGRGVEFFVDEDENRTGRTLENRPILHPREVKPDQDVYLALVPQIARKVFERLGKGPGTYHLPPPLDPQRGTA